MAGPTYSQNIIFVKYRTTLRPPNNFVNVVAHVLSKCCLAVMYGKGFACLAQNTFSQYSCHKWATLFVLQFFLCTSTTDCLFFLRQFRFFLQNQYLLIKLIFKVYQFLRRQIAIYFQEAPTGPCLRQYLLNQIP